jgi:hypothetical protein
MTEADNDHGVAANFNARQFPHRVIAGLGVPEGAREGAVVPATSIVEDSATITELAGTNPAATGTKMIAYD